MTASLNPPPPPTCSPVNDSLTSSKSGEEDDGRGRVALPLPSTSSEEDLLLFCQQSQLLASPRPHSTDAARIHTPSTSLSQQKLQAIPSADLQAFFNVDHSPIESRFHCARVRPEGNVLSPGCLFLTRDYLLYFASFGRYACPRLKGYLDVRSRISTTRKWLVLYRGLLYQATHSTDKLSIHTALPLQGATVRMDTRVRYGFVVSPAQGSSWSLRADHALQFHEWMVAIQRSIDLLHCPLRYGRLILPLQVISHYHIPPTQDGHHQLVLSDHYQDREYKFLLRTAAECTQLAHELDRLLHALDSTEDGIPHLTLHDSLDWSDMQAHGSAHSSLYRSASLSSLHMSPSSLHRRFLQIFSGATEEVVMYGVECRLKRFIVRARGPLFMTQSALYFAATEGTYTLHVPWKDIRHIKNLCPRSVREDTLEVEVHTRTDHFKLALRPRKDVDLMEYMTEMVAQHAHEENARSLPRAHSSSQLLQPKGAEELRILQQLEQCTAHANMLVPQHAHVPPLNIIIMTIGTRGDVQPYVALGVRLQSEGHTVTIATHAEFEEFVTSYGLRFACLPGNPHDLIEICVRQKGITPRFLKEAADRFLTFLEDLLYVAWNVCQGQDAIIEAPMIQAGIHVAEKLQVPHFFAFTMPFCPTKEYCNPMVPVPMGGLFQHSLNKMSHLLIEKALWLPLRSRINRFRELCCELPPLGLAEGSYTPERKTPFLYCFSSLLVPKPADWPDWVHVCGYWTLQQTSEDYQPDPALRDFLAQGEAPVYIGFGSIVQEDADRMWKIVIEAIQQCQHRIILSCGWTSLAPEMLQQLKENPNVFCLGACPHDWLFRQVRAVCHHGGAGTTATGLLCGRPTLVVSFFGDQPFWGKRVSDLGLGTTIPYEQLTAAKLTEGLDLIATSESMQVEAERIAERLAQEDGLANATQSIYRHVSAFYKHSQTDSGV